MGLDEGYTRKMSLVTEPASIDGSEMWLPITEYSVKSGMSLSTIRRKIKTCTLPFRFEHGRYLILLEKEPIRPDLKSHRTLSNQGSETDGTLNDPSVRMMVDAYEYALKGKDDRIRLLDKQIREMESHLGELRLLVQILEEKYEVRY